MHRTITTGCACCDSLLQLGRQTWRQISDGLMTVPSARRLPPPASAPICIFVSRLRPLCQLLTTKMTGWGHQSYRLASRAVWVFLILEFSGVLPAIQTLPSARKPKKKRFEDILLTSRASVNTEFHESMAGAVERVDGAVEQLRFALLIFIPCFWRRQHRSVPSLCPARLCQCC